MSQRPRWCDVVDSDEDDVVAFPPPLPPRFPFGVFLHYFLLGLFRRDVARSSMSILQSRLRRDTRVRSLEPWLQDLIGHLQFYPRGIRRQVHAFTAAFYSGDISAAALRKWQAWMRVQCFYDPPVYCRWAFAAIYIYNV